MTLDEQFAQATRLASDLGYVLVPEGIMADGEPRASAALQVARDIAKADGHVVIPAEMLTDNKLLCDQLRVCLETFEVIRKQFLGDQQWADWSYVANTIRGVEAVLPPK